MVTQRHLNALILLAGLGGSSLSFGFIDVGARVGEKWYSYDSGGRKDGYAYKAYTLDGHVDVLPILAVGLSLTKLDGESRDKNSHDLSSFGITELGLDAVVSVPLIPILTPYGRINFPLSSMATAKTKGGVKIEAETARIGDFSIAVGAAFSIIPLLKATIEVSHGVMMAKTTKATFQGQDLLAGDAHAKDSRASNVQSLMIGVMFSL